MADHGRLNPAAAVPLSLAIILAVSCAAGPETINLEKPDKGLYIVTDIEEYKRQVAETPDMELVDLEKEIEGIVLDIRYATTDNFTKTVIYPQAKAFLRRSAAQALKKAAEFLKEHNAGFKIYDAYRPYAATVRFHEVYPDKQYVADPRFGSRHNRGCTVQLSLVDLKTGKAYPMPTDFDDFSEKAHPSCQDLPKDARNNRDFLFQVMTRFGFTHYPTEWWRFDFNDWERYPLMDLSFEDLGRQNQG